MVGKRFNILLFLSLFYLVLPNLIFYVGYLRPLFAIPAFVLVSVSLVFASFSNVEYWTPNFDKKSALKGCAVIALVAVWVFLSGIGGVVWQNTDYTVRNPLFRALVGEKWPLIDQGRAIVYYIGFWLPAAVAGKIAGMPFALFFAQLWAASGILIFYAHWISYRKKFELWPLFLFVFFSGMDYFGLLLYQLHAKESLEPIFGPRFLQAWILNFQFSAFTIQLFHVFNQAIPAWIATMIFFNERDPSSVVFVICALLINSTFTAFGLVPFAVYLYVKNPKAVFSFQNIVGGFTACALTTLYVMNNSSLSYESFLAMGLPPLCKLAKYIPPVLLGVGCLFFPLFVKTKNRAVRIVETIFIVGILVGFLLAVRFATAIPAERKNLFVWYCVFIALEIGIPAFVLFKKEVRNPFYWISISWLLIAPTLKVGRFIDFCMRASIPSLLVLCVLCADYLSARDEASPRKPVFARHKFKKALLLFALLVGAITPIHEFYRTVYFTFSRANQKPDLLRDDLYFEPMYNTSGSADNFFFRHLAKRPKERP